MAKYECTFKGDAKEVLDIIDSAVSESVSATCEDSSQYMAGDVKCYVRVYERYSYSGGNRVSLNVTLVENAGEIFVSIITSGGSQGVLFKFNTWGEESFLESVQSALERYQNGGRPKFY